MFPTHIDDHIKKPSDKKNIYHKYRRHFWPHHITEEMKWFYLKDVLMKSAKRICKENSPNPLTLI